MFNFLRFINKVLKVIIPIPRIIVRSNYLFRKYYKNKSKNLSVKKKTVIFMSDEIFHYGLGLTDSFRGMTMLYKVSKILNVDFKINFTSPQNLTHYLIPNKYNWLIGENDMCYSTKYSVIFDEMLTSHPSIEALWRDYINKMDLDNILLLIKKLLKRYQQIHAYTNYCVSDKDYPVLFDELFKPSVELQKNIDENMNKIGSDFISVTFRFQQLLGDFTEGQQYPILNKDEQLFLIEKCTEHLLEIHGENAGKRILVTSDSITFLNAVKHLDFTYIIPGRIAHMGNILETEINVWMKSFIDYFMISNAKKIYLVIDGKMYDSGFAYRASLHNKVTYIIKKHNSCFPGFIT